jgi:ADP-ribosylglycohydrolase
MQKNIEDKIKGVLFGGAVGDALGLGTEFLTKQEVRQYYPSGLYDYSQIIQDKHRRRWKNGSWSDDTAQMLCIAKAIIKDKDIVPLNVAREFRLWLEDGPIGIGSNTYKVLSFSEYLVSPEEVSELVWKMSKYSNSEREYSAPNGGIMRTPIIGVWNSNIRKNAESICKLTHYDPRCVGSCVIVSILVNHLINDSPMSVDEMIQIGNQYDARIQEYIELSLLPDITSLELDDPNSMGYTLKALAAGLWVYFHCYSFEEGLKKIVNEGGDADTNAAVACSILGAKFGYSNIPEVYVSGLIGKDYLHQIAEELIRVILC